MTLLVDTSAFFALLDADDANHRAAVDVLGGNREQRLVTHNYLIVETMALVQRRLAADRTRAFVDHLLPIVTIAWVDEHVHAAATVAHVAALSRTVSFVDRVSFELMRRLGLRTAFAFDADFRRQGFDTVP